MFRRSSAVVATSRTGRRQPRSGREVRHRRWGRERPRGLVMNPVTKPTFSGSPKELYMRLNMVPAGDSLSIIVLTQHYKKIPPRVRRGVTSPLGLHDTAQLVDTATR